MKLKLITATVAALAVSSLAFAQSAVPPTNNPQGGPAKNTQVAQTTGQQGGQAGGASGTATGTAAAGGLSTTAIVGIAVAAGVVAVAASNKSSSTTSH
jgi:hypothetical protein